MDFGLSSKKALVLASSRGLGLGIAEALAAEGCTVMLVGRTADRIKANAEAITAKGKGKAYGMAADLGAPGAVEEIVALAEKTLGQIDILVNNTGGPPAKPATEVGADEWAKYFKQMVEPVFAITAKVLPGMRARKWGRVLTVASSGVEQPIPNLALSNALRSSIVGWSKTLSTEVAKDGVTVNMILPGRIATDRIKELDQANAQRSGKSMEEVEAASIATIPAARLGTAAEFGAVGAFLCSEAASYITGSKIRVDGGATRSI
jgi:3-oxoacyl-[acyl-carrier protein] reductase